MQMTLMATLCKEIHRNDFTKGTNSTDFPSNQSVFSSRSVRSSIHVSPPNIKALATPAKFNPKTTKQAKATAATFLATLGSIRGSEKRVERKEGGATGSTIMAAILPSEGDKNHL